MKCLTKITDLSQFDLLHIFDETKNLKNQFIGNGQNSEYFKNKSLAMLFEKPSLRTRLAFEVAATHLGGNAIKLSAQEVLLDLNGKPRESIFDIATNLSYLVDLVFARVFEHKTIEELAMHSTVPVVNGLSDLHHPTQAIADLYTIWETFEGFPEDLKIVFVGDPCNVANSLLLGCEILNIDFTLACPENYKLHPEIASSSAGKYLVTNNVVEALKNADIVYTDTWISMGLEDEAEQRLKDFADFQVNSHLMQYAKAASKFMHCLPAHRGQEVTTEVIDGPNSLVLKQAQAKLLTAKALIKFLTN